MGVGTWEEYHAYGRILTSQRYHLKFRSQICYIYTICLGEGNRKYKLKAIKRGGRPRGPSGIILGKDKTSRKPEIIARKRERDWELLIEIPEELLQKSDIKVKQDLKSLEQKQFTNRWILRDVTGNIEISGRYRVRDIRYCVADLSKTQKIIGVASDGSFENSLSDLVDWAKNEDKSLDLTKSVKELSIWGLSGVASQA